MKHRLERLREQLYCWIHGHRLARAPAYAGVLPNGQKDEELRYCEACGTPVWVSVPHECRASRRWADETV